MKQYIPNAITLLNLFAGCAAIVCILDGRFWPAFWLLFFAGLADYCDGMVARMLGVHSPLGKELDSMADLVSFGVAPGAILYTLLVMGPMEYDGAPPPGPHWWALPAFALSVFSGLRLARFNLDPRQTDHFIGLATPSSTTFVAGLMLVYAFDTHGLRYFVGQPVFLFACTAVLSFLLVSELPMFSFKFHRPVWKGNELKFIFAGAALLMLVVLHELALSLIILLYILLNLVVYWLPKRTTT